MLTVRRLALVLVSLLPAAGLAACGASKHTSTTGNTEAAKQQIEGAYVHFFSGKTTVSQRVALLQNGQKFKPVIEAFASNPLAKSASATVSSVTLERGDRARVVYTVKVGGAALPKQVGSAVRENGTWKVADSSLCRLVALQGSTPSICKS